MPQIISYKECPVCKSDSVYFIMEARDYTVSQKAFSIWQCNQCSLRFTQDVPTAEGIGSFYQSNDYISHSDTKKGIINKLYHSVRNITLKQKRKWVKTATRLQTGTVLDIGAGTGAFANEMKRAGWKVIALEPDETARNGAKTNYNLQLQLPEELFNQQAQSIDAITLWHVLEHVHHLHKYLQTFQNIIKKDGRLIIAVPNYTSFDAVYYQQYWAAYDVPRHLYHFSPRAMKTLLLDHGFEIESMLPMPFDAFYVSLLSEKYKRGKNNFIKAFSVGLRSNLKTLGKPEQSSSIIYIARKRL